MLQVVNDKFANLLICRYLNSPLPVLFFVFFLFLLFIFCQIFYIINFLLILSYKNRYFLSFSLNKYIHQIYK